MTFDAAIKQLSDGRAAKYPTWGGYVFRTDDKSIPIFSDKATYKVNDMVKKDGRTYICGLDINEPDIWNEANWLRADRYTLTFRKRQNGGQGKPNDIDYTYRPYISEGTLYYEVTPDGKNDKEPMLKLDATFLQALCSGDWMIGKTSDFEGMRVGIQNLW